MQKVINGGTAIMEKQKTMLVANDLGYGAVKAQADDERILFPSVIALLREQDIQDPVQFASDTDRDYYFEHFLEHMDVTVSSPSVTTQGRFLVGRSASESPLPLSAFDVSDFSGKSEEDLSLILTLSMIAAKRVKEAYQNGEDLTETLKANVVMATALPVNEIKRNNISNTYKERYLKGAHGVTFHNFGTPINVSLTFKNVYVMPEGETAQFYIAQSTDSKFKKSIEKDFKEHYPEMEDVSVEDLTTSGNVVGIDIGEGTTDIVVLVDGKADGLSSNSLEVGYGNVLQEAIEALQMQRFNFSERAKLQEFLAKPATGLNKARKQKVESIVQYQFTPFVNSITNATSAVMRKANSSTEVVFVYGGGSIPMKEQSDLRQRLSEKMKAFSGGFDIPVVWIDKEYAQLMNLNGLVKLVEMVSKQKA